MSLVVNTNVSSLTAQRALAYADSLQGEAMTRLSTGSKINSASDDAAGLAIAQRMTSQVQGLNMAIKNANDGISLTQSIEGALVEVSDMLQRMRELSIQSANDTNTSTDRSFIQEEINLLVAEISRVSSNTRYNNQLVLDGTFADRQIQVGTQGGETIALSIDSVSSTQLGAYTVTGDRIEARLGNGAGVSGNATAATDDFVINGNSLSKTIDVAATESAAGVAAKINAVSGETGVTAEAKTYAHLYSQFATDETTSLLINGKSTGSFVISNSNVADAVDKINGISGSTGVTAVATTDNKVKLYAQDGRDISVENESTVTNLKVQTVGFDGASTMPQKIWNRASAHDTSISVAQNAVFGNMLGALDGTYTLVQRSTGQTHTFSLASSGTSGEAVATDFKSAINGISGVSGFEVVALTTTGMTGNMRITATEDFGEFDIYAGSDISVAANKQTSTGLAAIKQFDDMANTAHGTFSLVNNDTGESFSFTTVDDASPATGSNTASKIDVHELIAAINGIEGVSGFSAHTKAVQSATATDDYLIHGSADFGDFDIKDSSGNTVLNSAGTAIAGDKNVLDVSLAAGNASNDTATIQGSLQLSSSNLFSITQSDEAAAAGTIPGADTGTNPAAPTTSVTATGSLINDNYFTTRSASLSTVSNVDLRTQYGAEQAISVLDGAIEKISSMRAKLGAVENRLDHTVSNLMNISENTEAARSRIQDSDFAAESAKLAKAQVLKQAGVGMLAQANAGSQLVLQLLQ
jgi:flagellin